MVVVEGKMELASIKYAFKKYSILGKETIRKYNYIERGLRPEPKEIMCGRGELPCVVL